VCDISKWSHIIAIVLIALYIVGFERYDGLLYIDSKKCYKRSVSLLVCLCPLSMPLRPSSAAEMSCDAKSQFHIVKAATNVWRHNYQISVIIFVGL